MSNRRSVAASAPTYWRWSGASWRSERGIRRESLTGYLRRISLDYDVLEDRRGWGHLEFELASSIGVDRVLVSVLNASGAPIRVGRVRAICEHLLEAGRGDLLQWEVTEGAKGPRLRVMRLDPRLGRMTELRPAGMALELALTELESHPAFRMGSVPRMPVPAALRETARRRGWPDPGGVAAPAYARMDASVLAERGVPAALEAYLSGW